MYQVSTKSISVMMKVLGGKKNKPRNEGKAPPQVQGEESWMNFCTSARERYAALNQDLALA
jgi:hypothetical protein